MTKKELEIMINLNERNIKARTKFYLETRDVKQRVRLLKLIVETNAELIRLREEYERAVA